MTDSKHFDVIIIGGSYAGLSAALALGRSLRSVLIIDAGEPCNRQTPHSQNFLTHDGDQPAEISNQAKQDVLAYETVQWHNGIAVSGEKTDKGFRVHTETGEEYTSTKLLLATGLKDVMPDIKGFKECWGITAIHCPYCHGYEFSNQKTALMANGERAIHLASLIKNLTSDLTILTNGKADFTPEQVELLKQNNLAIINDNILELEHEKGYIRNVVFNNGKKMPFTAMYAAIPFVQYDIAGALGVEFTEHGHIKINAAQHTTVDGVYACGDNSNAMRSVANAVYAGNITGAMINKALADEKFFG